MHNDEQSFTVLDVRGYVNGLIAATHQYTVNPMVVNLTTTHVHPTTGVATDVEERRVLDPLPPLNQPRAMMILTALTEEIISQMSFYKLRYDPLPAIAQALLDKAVPEDNDYIIAEEFICNDAVDTVLIELSRQVGFYINAQTWRQWEVASTHQLMGLIGGKDFRVAEWELYHGAGYRKDNEALRVNLLPTKDYIQSTLNHALNTPYGQLPMHGVVVDALSRHNTHHRFEKAPMLPLIELKHLGFAQYSEFYHRFVSEPIDSFILLFLQNRLDPNQSYVLELTVDFQLIATQRDHTPNEEQRHYRELRANVDAGDWVPEREIRWMNSYEKTHYC